MNDLKFKTVITPPHNSLKIKFQIEEDWYVMEDDDGGATIVYQKGHQSGDAVNPLCGGLYVDTATDKIQKNKTLMDFAKDNLKEATLAEMDIFQVNKSRVMMRGKSCQNIDNIYDEVNHIWYIYELEEENINMAIMVFYAAKIYYDKPGDLYYDRVELVNKLISESTFIKT